MWSVIILQRTGHCYGSLKWFSAEQQYFSLVDFIYMFILNTIYRANISTIKSFNTYCYLTESMEQNLEY
jgi:hypothetical protein